MEDYNAEEITGKKSGFTDRIKSNIKNSSVYQRVSAGLTAGLSLAYELYWMSKFREIDGYLGANSDGKVSIVDPSVKSIELLPIPSRELLPRDTPRSRELTEVTGIDAIIYKIAINPILAAGFMIGTVSLATVGAYWLGGKILPKKEKEIKPYVSKEFKPDISAILDRIEPVDMDEILSESDLEMELEA